MEIGKSGAIALHSIRFVPRKEHRVYILLVFASDEIERVPHPLVRANCE